MLPFRFPRFALVLGSLATACLAPPATQIVHPQPNTGSSVEDERERTRALSQAEAEAIQRAQTAGSVRDAEAERHAKEAAQQDALNAAQARALLEHVAH